MKQKSSSTTALLIKKSSVVIFFTILAAPLGYLIKILYSYTLSPELFGLLYALIGFAAIFKPYQDLGFSFSVSYFVPKLYDENDFSQIWLMFVYTLIFSLLASAVIVLGISFFAPWLATHYFKMSEAEPALYVLAMYIFATSVSIVFKNLYIGLQKETYYSVAEFLRLGLTLAISAVAWFLDAGSFIWYFLAWNITAIAVALYYLLVLIKNHPELPSLNVVWQPAVLKKLASFTIPHLSNQALYFLINQLGLIFLTYFTNVKEVGVYNIVLPIVSIPSIFLSPIQGVFFPMVSRFMKHEKLKIKVLVESILRIIPFVTLYFNFFVMMFPNYTIGVIFSEKWVEVAKNPLIIIALGYIFSDLSSYLTRVVDGMGLMKERVKTLVVIALVNVIFGYALISQFGVTGLVATNTVSFGLTSLLMARLIYSRLKFEFPWKFYAKFFVFLGVWFFLLKLMNSIPTTWAFFIGMGLIYSVTTALFGYTQGVLDTKQVSELQAMAKNAMKKMQLILMPT